jgi:hypothetical protein
MKRRAGTTALLLLLPLAAMSCGDSPPSSPPPDPATMGPAASLAAAVRELLARPDAPALERALADMQLDPVAFDDVLTAPYDRQYAGYQARFPAAVPALAAELRRLAAEDDAPSASSVAIRRHYAGDARLSLQQARLRWALPVQAESWLVEVGGALVDAVWVRRHGRWFLLLGLDEATRQILAAAAPECAASVSRAGRPGGCSDAAWMALDGAMRGDAARVARACARAQHHCL